MALGVMVFCRYFKISEEGAGQKCLGLINVTRASFSGASGSVRLIPRCPGEGLEMGEWDGSSQMSDQSV